MGCLYGGFKVRNFGCNQVCSSLEFKTLSPLLGIVVGIPIWPSFRTAFLDAFASGRVRSRGSRLQLRGHHFIVIHSVNVVYYGLYNCNQEPNRRNISGNYSSFCILLEPYCASKLALIQNNAVNTLFLCVAMPNRNLATAQLSSNPHLEDPDGYSRNFGCHTKTTSDRYVRMYVCKYVCTHLCIYIYIYVYIICHISYYIYNAILCKRISLCLSVYHLSIDLSIHPSIHPSIYRSFELSTYL